MIAVVWIVLAGSVCGGMYSAARILAREDMPLGAAIMSLPRPEAAHESAVYQGGRAGESDSGGGGSARSSSAAGQSTYQVLYAMASAVNEAWLDRLFSGTGTHHA